MGSTSVTTEAVSDDLAWWRAHGTTRDADKTAIRAVLGRLRAWKTAHDQDRALQGPFQKMAWDWVFSDEDEQVDQAIRQIEASLGG